MAISTWITDLNQAHGGRYFAIRRATDDALLVRAHVTCAWVELDTGQPVPIPHEFITDCTPNLAADVIAAN